MARKFCSGYVNSLVGTDLNRYETKIRLCGGIDPYEIDFLSCDSSIENLPGVTSIDLYNYLVLSTNTMSMKQMKAYKSLEAYNYLTSGLVKDIRTKTLATNVLVLGKVGHSQTMSAAPLKAWVLATRTGEVTTAHCTCMAGLGEACSHVAAVLFALEYATTKKEATTCTSKANAWLPPALENVPFLEVKDYDFSSAKMKQRKLMEDKEEGRPATTLSKITVSSEERLQLLQAIHEDNPDAALFRVIPEFCSEYATKGNTLPQPLSALFDKALTSLPISELQDRCDTIFASLKLTEDECHKIEKATGKQAGSSAWMIQRSGRITASNMKSACRSAPSNPSVSLLKKICYPSEMHFYSAATEWGKKMEAVAKQNYLKHMQAKHTNFIIRNSGLWVSAKYPYIAASPDGLASCDCHSDRLVEIKCPTQDKENNSGICGDVLDKQHMYYYQVQTQMLVVGMELCDFVVWRPNQEPKIISVLCDKDVQEEILRKSEVFFKQAVLPELVAKYFTSLKHTALGASQNYNGPLVCYCQEPPQEPMIVCRGDNCTFSTFHQKCVNVCRSKKDWLCPECVNRK